MDKNIALTLAERDRIIGQYATFSSSLQAENVALREEIEKLHEKISKLEVNSKPAQEKKNG